MSSSLKFYLLAGKGGERYQEQLDSFVKGVQLYSQTAEVLYGDLRCKLNLDVGAIITPGNSYGHMTGGLDKAVVEMLGGWVEREVRAKIRTDYCCELNVGDAIMVSNDISIIKNVIYAPTMRSPKKLPFGDDSPYRSVLAALQLINRFNRDCPDEVKIRSVILPMMGSNTGEVPYPNVLCQMIRAIQRYSNPKPIEDLFQDGQDTDAFMKVIWNNQFT